MNLNTQLPDIVFLNGASSSGKSTLARALQTKLPIPYFHYSSDLLVDGGFLPAIDRSAADTPWSWNIVRPKFFDGFHRSISAFSTSGNKLIVDHVVEHRAWLDELVEILAACTVFYVGVHCSVAEINRREIARGDRTHGEGRSHLDDGIHTWSAYDFEVDTQSASPGELADVIVDALSGFEPTNSVFRRLQLHSNI